LVRELPMITVGVPCSVALTAHGPLCVAATVPDTVVAQGPLCVAATVPETAIDPVTGTGVFRMRTANPSGGPCCAKIAPTQQPDRTAAIREGLIKPLKGRFVDRSPAHAGIVDV
jgi:hypothetical protein